ncbi:methyltransferase domain-containing protein [bacterium]|nr:methyltransferase domain-containing protein [bacterium]
MPAMNEIDTQRDYWNREREAFDAIYTHRKSTFSSMLDSVFRKDMYDRLNSTLAACEPLEGRSILDVGCGTGVYALELARRGAQHVCGIDIAERMVEACTQRAEEEKLENTSFIRGEVQDLEKERQYDVSIGIGLFDYIKDPVPTLREMALRTKSDVVATFPRVNTWRAPIRKIRLSMRGCPVYFFSARGVKSILREAGLHIVEFKRLGKLYFVVARPEKQ